MFRDPQVNLYVRDVEASVRFYADLLGFEESFRTPASGRPVHVELRLGGLVLGLADVESAREVHDLAVDTVGPRAEVVVWTDDVDHAYEQLLAAGAPSISQPHDFLGGRLRAAWVADPDGGPVEIVMERASEPSPHSVDR